MSKNDISVRNYSVTTINDIENNLTVLHKEADLSVGHALNAQLCVINVVKSPSLYSSAIDLFFEHMKSGMSLCRNDAEIKECRQRYCLMLNNMLFFTRAKIEFEVKANRELGRTLMLQAIDDKICIMISHRLSQTKFFDRIFVMKDGTIVETGTHKELISKNGLYKQMYSKQAKKYGIDL